MLYPTTIFSSRRRKKLDVSEILGAKKPASSVCILTKRAGLRVVQALPLTACSAAARRYSEGVLPVMRLKTFVK